MIAEAIAPKARARNQAQSIDWLQSLLHTPQQGETRVVQDGMDWKDYLALDAIRDERGGFRVAFLDGVIELMFPSFEHEIRKSNVSRILEAWLGRSGHRLHYSWQHHAAERDQAGRQGAR